MPRARAEYPYKFVKVLKSQQLIEKDTVTLACELDDAGGDVKWFKNDEEVVPDKRVQVVRDGRKRKLVIKDAKVTDAGQYSCVSNADKTEAEIIINCKCSLTLAQMGYAAHVYIVGCWLYFIVYLKGLYILCKQSCIESMCKGLLH